MPDIEEMKNKAAEAARKAQNQTEQQGEEQDENESTKDKAGNMMDDVKKKMDVTGDGKVGADDVKKMGEDAVNKVKGMFKKD